MALGYAPNLTPSRKGKEQPVPHCRELGIQHLRAVLGRSPRDHRTFGVGRDLCGSSSPTPAAGEI